MLKFTGLLAEQLLGKDLSYQQFVKLVELLRLYLDCLTITFRGYSISTLILVFSFAHVLPLQVQYV